MKHTTKPPRLLKVHREQIEILERDGIKVTPVRHAAGNHVLVQIERGGAVSRIQLVTSPGDVRGMKRLLTCANIRLREALQEGAA